MIPTDAAAWQRRGSEVAGLCPSQSSSQSQTLPLQPGVKAADLSRRQDLIGCATANLS
jgi:hypothetical protein